MTSWCKENVIDFINLYRSHECLWMVKSKNYSNKHMREQAYDSLLQCVKKFEPAASRDSITKKINNLRTSFRKECRKVESSKLSGSGIEDIYVPKLWYFDQLVFLKDQDIPRQAQSNLKQAPQDIINVEVSPSLIVIPYSVSVTIN